MIADREGARLDIQRRRLVEDVGLLEANIDLGVLGADLMGRVVRAGHEVACRTVEATGRNAEPLDGVDEEARQLVARLTAAYCSGMGNLADWCLSRLAVAVDEPTSVPGRTGDEG